MAEQSQTVPPSDAEASNARLVNTLAVIDQQVSAERERPRGERRRGRPPAAKVDSRASRAEEMRDHDPVHQPYMDYISAARNGPLAVIEASIDPLLYDVCAIRAFRNQDPDTANLMDARKRGYIPVRPDEVPGLDNVFIISGGDNSGFVRVRDCILMKRPRAIANFDAKTETDKARAPLDRMDKGLDPKFREANLNGLADDKFQFRGVSGRTATTKVADFLNSGVSGE